MVIATGRQTTGDPLTRGRQPQPEACPHRTPAQASKLRLRASDPALRRRPPILEPRRPKVARNHQPFRVQGLEDVEDCAPRLWVDRAAGGEPHHVVQRHPIGKARLQQLADGPGPPHHGTPAARCTVRCRPPEGKMSMAGPPVLELVRHWIVPPSGSRYTSGTLGPLAARRSAPTVRELKVPCNSSTEPTVSLVGTRRQALAGVVGADVAGARAGTTSRRGDRPRHP